MLGKIEGRRRRDDRGWDGWMASLTRWTWVWVSSWSFWWTGKPGMLQPMGSQKVGHNWATERNYTENIRDYVGILDLKITSNVYCKYYCQEISIIEVFRLVMSQTLSCLKIKLGFFFNLKIILKTSLRVYMAPLPSWFGGFFVHFQIRQ